MTHGTYTSYTKHGCRCHRCKRAKAHYQAILRKKKLAGHVIMGAIISAAEATALLNKLHREQFTNTRLAHELGLHSPQVKVHPRITVRKHLRIKRVYHKFMDGAA